jgi:hypothetical protein
MKIFCLRLVIFIGILIPFSFPLVNKADAKAPYDLTWKVASASSNIVIKKTTIDSAGNIYYSGTVTGDVPVAFDPIDGVSDVKTATDSALFLTKINTDGTYGYTYLYDGAVSISLKQIRTDHSGNVYLLGSFQGLVNFDPTGSSSIIDSGTDTWSFLVKLDTSGVYLSTYTWQNPLIDLEDMAIDSGNNVFLTGAVTVATDSAQLDPVSASDNQIVASGESIIFQIKLDSVGTYGYSKIFRNNSSNYFEVDNITTDYNDNLYILGVFAGTPDFNGTSVTSNGGNDIFLSKYDSAGNAVFTYKIGGGDNESALTMGVASSGAVFVAGTYNGTVNFDPTGGMDNKTASVADERFLTIFNSDGSYGKTLIWQGINTIEITKVAFDANNLIYIFGSAPGDINFDPTGGVDQKVSFGSFDAFMTILNTDETYDYTYTWGGIDDEQVLDASFDGFNNLYLAGYTQSPSVNFNPTGIGTDDIRTLQGTTDGFVMKLLTSQSLPIPTPGPQGNPPTFGVPQQSFTCTNPSPSAPTLFQITSLGSQATLYTAPTADQSNSYTVSYGLDAAADMYSVSFDDSDKSGAVPYTINYLNTNSTYYFKIRANNDCMPGSWSKILNAKTLVSATFTSYYSPSNSFGNTSGNTSNNTQCTQYTVMPGDSLWAIAQKLLANGKRYLELWNSNTNTYPSLKSSSVIRSGWKLNVNC